VWYDSGTGTCDTSNRTLIWSDKEETSWQSTVLPMRPPLYKKVPGSPAKLPDYNIWWLLVSKKRNLMVTFIPKVMCTSIRTAISLVECHGTKNPNCHEGRSRNNGINEMTDISTMTRVVVVRDPFERVISAYENAPENRFIYLPKCRGGQGYHTCSLWDWVNVIANQTEEAMRNEHIKPQTRIAQFDKVHYHYVLRMSSQIDQDFFWKDLLQSKPIGTDGKINSKRENSIEAVKEKFDSVTNDTLHLIAELYGEDLAMWAQVLHHGTMRQEGEFTLYDYYKKYLEKESRVSSLDRPTTVNDLLPLGYLTRKSTKSPVGTGLDPLTFLTSNQKVHDSTDRRRPNFVFHMHIPKTGGRTFTSSIRPVLNKRFPSRSAGSCSWNLCCTSWDSYIRDIKSNTVLNGDPSHICRSFSREITASGILATKQSTIGIQSENSSYHNAWWYTASLYRNPLGRFASVAKHSMRRGRCDTNQLSRAVYAKLRGGCPDLGHDREQAQYFYKVQPFDPYTTEDPFVPAKNATVLEPWAHISDFDFVGITDYMDASTCVLAMDLAAVKFAVSTSKAQKVCMNPARIKVKDEKNNESDLDPLTTLQVLRILKNRFPVDAQMYPLVLEVFQHKLAQVLEDYPRLTPLYQEDLDAIALEKAAWFQVAAWLRDVKNNDAMLFQLLHGLSNKNTLAPGMRWGAQVEQDRQSK